MLINKKRHLDLLHCHNYPARSKSQKSTESELKLKSYLTLLCVPALERHVPIKKSFLVFLLLLLSSSSSFLSCFNLQKRVFPLCRFIDSLHRLGVLALLVTLLVLIRQQWRLRARPGASETKQNEKHAEYYAQPQSCREILRKTQHHEILVYQHNTITQDSTR